MKTLIYRIAMLVACTLVQPLASYANSTPAGKIEIIFSKDPFEGDNPTNKTQTTFKAWDEIYGRINFGKPIKDLLTGSLDNVMSDGKLTIAIGISEKQDDKYPYQVEKKITREEAEKSYVDFDIAPALNRSRDAISRNFASQIASYGNEHFRKREPAAFYVSLDKREEKMYSGGFATILTIDYSNLPDGDAGTDKISKWEQMINQASDEEQVKTNIKKKSVKTSIQFSSSPFTDSPAISTGFKAGNPIYGRVVLEKPLKEYLNGKQEVKDLQIDIKCLNDNLYGISVEKFIRASELEQPYLNFDILPATDKAIDVYSNNLGFYRTFYSSSLEPGRVLKFEISLANETNINYKGFKKMEAFGEMEVDYSGLTHLQIQAFAGQAEKALQAAEKNASALFAKESAEALKAMPMPIVFTRPSHAGYSTVSKPQLLNIIKARYKVAEVFMLTFAEPTAAGDFTVWKDNSGYPTEKRGHHYFYFVFKDTDGYYKFSGGVLSMPYEGGGKYGAPILLAWTPIQEGDPKFPFDNERWKKGYETVFFFDAGKVKK
ncbi:MAG: hypothetical protein K0S32_2245 [Bacteroidetes bacterium]|jgi:hypothetical protein|nr:hypothetical protein [Bacteroidota bacterium]